jgi:hypothetical protein
MRRLTVLLVAILSSPAVADDRDAAPARPTMRQIAGGGLRKPPSARDLIDARAALKARFRGPLSHTETAAGAVTTAAIFLDAALAETDSSLRWLLLDEARRLGAAAGDADIIRRSVALQSATFDFDEIEAELESLGQVPLRALDPRRATQMAAAAEALADRAAADGRRSEATDAQMLAVRSWQRAGNRQAAHAAAAKQDALARGN